MNTSDILNWLREDDPARLERLWAQANRVRREHVGDEVHLRGLVEISNYCRRGCLYCGLRVPRDCPRYRMSREEIVACARQARELGYGTVVLQSGEDPGLTEAFVGQVIRDIKRQTGLAVTLSLGERSPQELRSWRQGGADRYLLRFETSDPGLYRYIHPPPAAALPYDRFDLLHILKALGYETGSGVMVGIPGQRYASLARDLELFRELDLDMVGLGPFIGHPDTPLGGGKNEPLPEAEPRVPGSELMACKALALTRILCPDINIPSTTALAVINQGRGRLHGLARGANVIMPNLTPARWRRLYEIYPQKALNQETAAHTQRVIHRQIRSLNRRIGRGPGFRGNTATRLPPNR